MENFEVFFKVSYWDFPDQPWATQIGSRAKFLLNSHFEGQSRDF